jgi:hypothetical protein
MGLEKDREVELSTHPSAKRSGKSMAPLCPPWDRGAAPALSVHVNEQEGAFSQLGNPKGEQGEASPQLVNGKSEQGEASPQWVRAESE